MGERRMLIVPAELVKKIDDNRGDMTQALLSISEMGHF